MSMTKEQLIEKNKELEEIVNRQSHLPSAVEEKDQEINALRKALKEEQDETTNLRKDLSDARIKIENLSHLPSAIDAKDAEIARLKKDYAKEVETKDKTANKDFDALKEMHTEQLARIEEETKKVVAEYDRIIKRKDAIIVLLRSAQDSFFKNIQGALENAINLSQYTNREE